MLTHQQQRREQAALQLRPHGSAKSAPAVVESLVAGLTTLRKLLLTRVHKDVEDFFGLDSALAPITGSEVKREIHVLAWEVELFSLALAADEATASGFLREDRDWSLRWLIELRLGTEPPSAAFDRARGYLTLPHDKQRLRFASIVERTLPEATKAPLVIYRLYPRAVRVATAVAFGDPLRAGEIRNEQISILPAITDCHHCHGRPLDNGEVCQDCGNPLWKINWLCVAD